jgi:hypothetical protein
MVKMGLFGFVEVLDLDGPSVRGFEELEVKSMEM